MVFPTSESFEVTTVNGKTEKRSRPRARQFPEHSMLNYYNIFVQNYRGDPPLKIKKIAKNAYDWYPNISEIHYINKDKLKIVTSDLTTANGFLNDKRFGDYRVTVPFDDVEIKGVVGIPTDDDDGSIITEKNIFENCKIKHKPEFGLIEHVDDIEILEVKRFMKFSKEREQPATALNRVLLTFSGKILPSHILMDNILFPVMSYRQPVLQCFKCYRYKHSTRACNKTQTICRRCAKHHSFSGENNAPVECVDVAKCVNCKGNHPSNDRSCAVFLRHKAKSDEKAAREQPKKRPIFSLEDFPPLGARAPKTTKKNSKPNELAAFQGPSNSQISTTTLKPICPKQIENPQSATIEATASPSISTATIEEITSQVSSDNSDNQNSFTSTEFSGFGSFDEKDESPLSSMETNQNATSFNKRNRPINSGDSEDSDLPSPIKKNNYGD